MNAVNNLIDDLTETGRLWDDNGELCATSSALIIALHELGLPGQDRELGLVKAAYKSAGDNDWHSRSIGTEMRC